VALSFWHKHFDDNYDSMPATFTDHTYDDGVAFSADGTTWHKVTDLPSRTLSYSLYRFDLDAMAAAAGVSFTSTFKIKFQQYGHSWDGFAFDDISLADADVTPTIASITPDNALTNSSVPVTIAGTNLSPETQVTLERDGETTIAATTESAVSDTELTCTLDLTGAAVGTWDVVATNPDGGTDSLEDGFTVTSICAASFPFTEDFESDLDCCYGPHGGTQHVTLDSSTFASYVLNELTLTVDLAGHSNVALSFWHKHFGDSVNSMPASFAGHSSTDGVAFSANGTDWYRVTALPARTSDYSLYQFDLDAMAAAAGVPLTSTFKIKFQQYGFASISTEGFAFDDISLADADVRPTVTSIDPDTGQQGNTLTATVTGTNLNPETQVTLERDGETTIAATSESFASDTELTCRLDLEGAVAGAWDVVVTNPDGGTDSLEDGFTVTSICAASFPFTEDFESDLDCCWTTWSSNTAGRIQLTSSYSPHGGSQHVTLDSSDFVDLAGHSNVALSFWHKHFSDSVNSMPASFTGHSSTDGVAFSANGTDWYRVTALPARTSDYSLYQFDLDAMASAAGVPLPSTFKIKFQQYGNLPLTSDGFAFDDISLADADVTPTIASITPDTGIVDSSPTVTISGANLNPGSEVTLERDGETTIEATGEAVSATEITCRLDLTDAALGAWDVFVTNPETGIATLDDGFTVVLPCAAGFPFTEDFESDLDCYWTTWSSDSEGRIQVTSENGPHAGSQHVTLDRATYSYGNYSLNEMILTIDLAGESSVALSFWHKHFSDATDGMASSFTGRSNADGVAFSANGTDWYKVTDLPARTTDYALYSFDLDALAAAAGVSFTSTFKIKFQQYGGYYIPNDGFAFDDIALAAGDGGPSITSITPDTGIVDSSLEVTVGGANFNPDSEVTLERDGETPIEATGATVSATEIDCRLDLTGAALGTWDVVVTNPETGAATLEDGFTVVLPCEASFPFTEDFESDLDCYWTTWSSDSEGRIQVTSENGPHAGSQHVTLDRATYSYGNYTLNEMVLTIDLAGHPNVGLTFWHRHFSDELQAMPASFTGHTNADGVAFSANGTDWYTLTDLPDRTYSYSEHQYDLDAAAAAAGVPLNATFKIKFQQYGYANIATDGFAFDDIVLADVDFAPTVVSITPDSGVTDTTVAITDLAGTNFLPGASVKLQMTGEPDVEATNVTVVDTTQITCDLDLTDVEGGDWDVVVTNPGGLSGTLPAAFHVYDTLTVTGIVPSQAVTDSTVYVSDLQGTGFIPGASVALRKAGETDIAGTGVSVLSESRITCTFDLTGAAVGTWDVVVTNPNTVAASLDDGFTVVLPCEASFPFTEDFESDLDCCWTTWSEPNGRIQVTSAYAPHAGIYHVTMDTTTGYALNELILTIDLAGHPNVGLSFWHKHFGDEVQAMPTSFTGHTHADGVAFSANGTDWHALTDLPDRTSAYSQYQFDLDAAAAVAGVPLNATFKIKFQQYDNYPISTDGFAFDNIAVELPPPTVTAIDPSWGVNNAPASVTITGTGFQIGASATLERDAEDDIAGTFESVVSETEITCDFDIAGATTGLWDVTVTNPDTQSGTLPEGFDVLLDVSPPDITGWTVAAEHGGGVGELLTALSDSYVEPRVCAVDCLVVSFDEPLNPATFVPSCVSIVGATNGDQSAKVASVVLQGDGSLARITLSEALPQPDRYTVTISTDVQDLAGNALGSDRDIQLNVLHGDANGNGTVDIGDMLAVRARFGQPVNETNCRYDINCNGVIDIGDMLAVRARFGHSLPPAP